MLEREDLRQVRSVIKDVLREGHLDKLPDLFGREHHKHRGTHDLTFQQIVDVPDYIDNRQFITIVNEGGDGMAFVDLLGTDHQIVVTKNPEDFTLSLDSQVHVHSATEQPYIRISNLSDTELDPALQFALAAGDNVQFTIGVDDSDGNKLKFANLSALGTLAETQGTYGEILVYFHDQDDNLAFVDLADFSTDGVLYNGTSGTGDGQFGNVNSITYDGAFIYVADNTNSRIQKFDAASGVFVSKVAINRPWGVCYWDGFIYTMNQVAVGGHFNLYKIDAASMTVSATYPFDSGTGNDEFNQPRGLASDGTNLYICDYSNNRIKKCSMAGVYISKVGSSGTGNGQFNGPVDCEIDGTYLYVCDYGNKRIQIFDIATMTYQAQHATQTFGASAGSPSSISINDLYYYVGCNNSVPYNGYIEKYDIATRSYQAVYDCIPLASRPDVVWSGEIAKFASSGVKYGDLVVLHQDGSFLDVWAVTRFVDDIRLIEDGDLATGDYVGLRAPAAVTASYSITFPAAVPGAAGHFAVGSSGIISWGQDLGTTAGPSFDHAHLTVAIGTAPMVVTSTTKVANLNADLLDGNEAAAFAAAVHYHDSDYISIISSPAANHFPYQTAGGELVDSGYDAADFAAAGHTHALDDLSDVNAGAPNDNDVLSWDSASGKWIAVAPSGGAGAFLDLTDVTEADYTGHANQFVKVNAAETGLEFVASSVAAHALSSASHTDVDAGTPSDNDILRFDTASGTWKNEALPAASNHDLLSATHSDTLADTVVRGDLMIGNSTPKWARLAKGTSGYLLKMGADDPAWAAQSTFKLDDWGTPDDNTDLDFGTARHGLCPKGPAGTNKDQWLCGDGSWSYLHTLFGPKLQGRYYSGGMGSSTLTTASFGADYMRAVPFIVTKAHTYDRIGLGITAGHGAGRYLRLGIYNTTYASGYPYPDALILDSGAMEITSSAFWETVISQLLTPGLYWLVMLNSYAFTIRLANVSGCPIGYILGAPDGATGQDGYLTVSQAYGALPNPFTAGAAPSTAGDYFPNIVLRVA